MKTLTRLALTTLLATGLATAAWAYDAGFGDGKDFGNWGDCYGKTPGKYYTSSGKVMNVFPAHKANGGKKKAAMSARPKAKASPKPHKKVNFTTKRK